MKRILFIISGSMCALLGFIGVFVPVLPTTPLLLLAAFLFARSSERMRERLEQTKVYKTYVLPFKEDGGITAASKVRILAISYFLMGCSAYFVQKWFVWVILGLVALWLLYLMLIRIPTVGKTISKAEKDETELD